ncbi:MAG: radical SAM protein [Chloroflexaceae bacterium]|nr:radical SAM protein [Chloroflexaceae bacterium]
MRLLGRRTVRLFGRRTVRLLDGDSSGRTVRLLAATAHTLVAWLHTTDRCNLRCDYCYLPHLPTDMTIETGQAAIDATLRSAQAHGYRRIKLKYAGGEALLRFPFVAELHRYAEHATHMHGIGLDGVVLSNGTLLTAAMVNELQALGLRLMLSLDGVGTAHDRQRSYANGRGSWEQVARAVDLALAYGLVPDISITVSGRNAADLPALVAWVLERDLPFGLNFYRENDYAASNADLRYEEQQMIEGMRAAYRVIEQNLPCRSLLASLVDRANLAVAHSRTCGVGQNYLVFDWRGQVAKCQMQMRQTVASAADVDPLAAVRADSAGIQNIDVKEKTGCRDCAWKHWCTGGCPLATYRATGRYDVQSPNCTIYRTLYPEVVRLEQMRVQRYEHNHIC